jgi:Fe-S-cluster containining protein
MTLEEHIRRYLELVERADNLFATVQQSYGDLMACRPGCDECCHVYYELSLIEAFYLNGMFSQEVSGKVREKALFRAEKALPKFNRARADLARIASQAGTNTHTVENSAAAVRIPCPLNEQGTCVLYKHRPITCRLYGTPQKIGQRVVSCPNCSFEAGRSYQTVDVAAIQEELFRLSADLLRDLLGVSLKERPGPTFPMPFVLTRTFDKELFIELGESLR